MNLSETLRGWIKKSDKGGAKEAEIKDAESNLKRAESYLKKVKS